MSYKVEDVMHGSVVTVESNYTVRQATKLMDYRGVSSLVVITKKQLSGIITEKDVCTRVVAKGRDPERVKVEEVMTQQVITVKPDLSLESAVQVMLTQGIKKLPVLGGEFGEDLVGMLSFMDIVMFYPAIYASMKKLQDSQLVPVEKGVDFYII